MDHRVLQLPPFLDCFVSAERHLLRRVNSRFKTTFERQTNGLSCQEKQVYSWIYQTRSELIVQQQNQAANDQSPFVLDEQFELYRRYLFDEYYEQMMYLIQQGHRLRRNHIKDLIELITSHLVCSTTDSRYIKRILGKSQTEYLTIVQSLLLSDPELISVRDMTSGFNYAPPILFSSVFTLVGYFDDIPEAKDGPIYVNRARFMDCIQLTKFIILMLLLLQSEQQQEDDWTVQCLSCFWSQFVHSYRYQSLISAIDRENPYIKESHLRLLQLALPLLTHNVFQSSNQLDGFAQIMTDLFSNARIECLEILHAHPPFVDVYLSNRSSFPMKQICNQLCSGPPARERFRLLFLWMPTRQLFLSNGVLFCLTEMRQVHLIKLLYRLEPQKCRTQTNSNGQNALEVCLQSRGLRHNLIAFLQAQHRLA